MRGYAAVSGGDLEINGSEGYEVEIGIEVTCACTLLWYVRDSELSGL